MGLKVEGVGLSQILEALATAVDMLLWIKDDSRHFGACRTTRAFQLIPVSLSSY